MQMDSEHIVLSRLLPKTGQTQPFKSGDDGHLEKGWWKNRPVVTNRERFVAKTINGDDVVIDRATGLMWAADGNESGSDMGDKLIWIEVCLYAEQLIFAGFSDWRIPNIVELVSIVDFGRYNPAIDPLFVNTHLDTRYWSATTVHNTTTAAFYVEFTNGGAYYIDKGNASYIRCVRSL